MSTWKVEIINSSKWIINGRGNMVMNVDNFSDKAIYNILKLHKEECQVSRNKGYEDMRKAYKEVEELKKEGKL